MTIHTAIELNNIAADVLECGTVGDARNICRASVLHLRTNEMTNQRTTGTVREVSSTGQSFQRGEDTVHADVLQARMELEESRRMCASAGMHSNQQIQAVSQSPASSFQPTNPQDVAAATTASPILDQQSLRLLYNRPIRILFDENGEAPSTISSTTTAIDLVEQISGIVLYNFALGHQKLAIRDQDIVHMHKASALYDMALKLLMSDVARQTRELNVAEDTDDEYNLPANQRQDSIVENLTLLCAAACLHNSAQISLLLNGKGADIVNLLDAVHKLCNLESKRASRRGDDPENSNIDTEEAWNLFFFSALSLPLSGISRAA